MVSDSELARRMQAGDRAALGELYARYLPAVWRYVWAHVRPDDAGARDAVSETFLAALRGGHEAAKGTVAQWLMGIARHKIADARRLRRPTGESADVQAEVGDPAGKMVSEEERAAVSRVMLELEDDERLALEWKYLDGASVREIGARMDRTEKAAEALLFRAREKFRARARAFYDAKET